MIPKLVCKYNAITYKKRDIGEIFFAETNLKTKLIYGKLNIGELSGVSIIKELNKKIEEILEGLNAAKGFLRREVGKGLSIYQTPELHFVYDDSVARGAAMSILIDTAVKDKAKDAVEDTLGNDGSA